MVLALARRDSLVASPRTSIGPGLRTTRAFSFALDSVLGALGGEWVGVDDRIREHAPPIQFHLREPRTLVASLARAPRALHRSCSASPATRPALSPSPQQQQDGGQDKSSTPIRSSSSSDQPQERPTGVSSTFVVGASEPTDHPKRGNGSGRLELRRPGPDARHRPVKHAAAAPTCSRTQEGPHPSRRSHQRLRQRQQHQRHHHLRAAVAAPPGTAIRSSPRSTSQGSRCVRGAS